jgi:hypothetical protein
VLIIGAAWLIGGTSVARASEVRGGLSVLGQVRDGDQSRETETPVNLYGVLGADRLPGGVSADTYFRLERDFARGDGASDFYAGALRLPYKGVEMSLGRQIINEVPGGMYVADAGRVRFDPGWPVVLTLFGGQPRYFEPTYSSESLSQDEQIFGGSIRTRRLHNGSFGLGFLQQHRDGRTLRQLVSATMAQAFPRLPGLPNLYGMAAYDADRQNIDLGTIGVDLFVLSSRLSMNLETGYYKPQDDGTRRFNDINRLEDPLFSLFSISSMKQGRGGLRFAVFESLSIYGDYSYQRYEQLPGVQSNGHVASGGLLWLPGGDGLEVVRAEYYLVDSGGGNVNGARLYYESRVYEGILFRTKLDVSYYRKASNQQDTAVSGRIGLGYLLAPGLLAEVSFEGNRNARFDDDLRFGFFLTYNLRYRTGDLPRGVDPGPRRLPGGWAG